MTGLLITGACLNRDEKRVLELIDKVAELGKALRHEQANEICSGECCLPVSIENEGLQA